MEGFLSDLGPATDNAQRAQPLADDPARQQPAPAPAPRKKPPARKKPGGRRGVASGSAAAAAASGGYELELTAQQIHGALAGFEGFVGLSDKKKGKPIDDADNPYRGKAGTREEQVAEALRWMQWSKLRAWSACRVTSVRRQPFAPARPPSACVPPRLAARSRTNPCAICRACRIGSSCRRRARWCWSRRRRTRSARASASRSTGRRPSQSSPRSRRPMCSRAKSSRRSSPRRCACPSLLPRLTSLLISYREICLSLTTPACVCSLSQPGWNRRDGGRSVARHGSGAQLDVAAHLLQDDLGRAGEARQPRRRAAACEARAEEASCGEERWPRRRRCRRTLLLCATAIRCASGTNGGRPRRAAASRRAAAAGG